MPLHNLGSATYQAEVDVDVDEILRDNFSAGEVFWWLVVGAKSKQERSNLWGLVKAEFHSEIEDLIFDRTEGKKE